MSDRTKTSTDQTLRVWVACLHHYTSGRLLGRWVDAIDAGDLTLTDLHAGQGAVLAGCEEVWCFDLDNFPVSREMGVQEAVEWGEAYAELAPDEWPALSAWVESGAYVAAGDGGDVPVVADFRDHYQGQWGSFREFAEHWVTEADLFDKWPETAQRYFDWDAWARDLAFDYTVMDAPGGTVFIFTNP